MESNGQRKSKKCNSNWLLLLIILKALMWTQTEALECYACDSTADPECSTKPGQQIEVEECASDTDECVQVVVAGITRRGCLSRLFPSRYCPEPCERCTKSLCNRDIFPRERLRCYQCSGGDCVNVDNKPNLILPCPFYHEHDRCYMNVLHASNVQRGCEHSVSDASNCPNSCIKCNSSGCNKESGIWFQNCLECSHTSNAANPECWRGQDVTANICVAATKKYCQNKNLYGEEGKCFTYINEQTGVVNRGCSNAKPFYPTGNLTECYGENCNNDCLTTSCNICSSKEDVNCVNGKNLKSTKCSTETQSCFSCESGNVVRRGCVDAMFNPTRQKYEACYMCRDSSSSLACNRFPVRTCYSCSSFEDEDCDVMFYPGSANQRNCSSHDDLCVTTVVSKLHLVYVLRGCASHLSECTESDPLCVRCNGSLCNDVSIDLSYFDPTSGETSNSLTFLIPDESKFEIISKDGVGKPNANFCFISVLVLFVLYSDFK